jgi:hypothetical protein
VSRARRRRRGALQGFTASASAKLEELDWARYAITVTTARAGITDPAPVGFVHVWTIPGVIHNISVGTAFVCTATDANTVSVEVFDAAVALQSNGASAALAAGEPATFVTQTLPLTGAQSLSVGPFLRGSARVVATATKVVCTAFVMDTAGTQISTLPILKKKKQKGD